MGAIPERGTAPERPFAASEGSKQWQRRCQAWLGRLGRSCSPPRGVVTSAGGCCARRCSMATRTSFRPRPLDHNKQIEIIRDFTQLDSTSTDAAGQPQAITLDSIIASAEVGHGGGGSC